MLGFHSNHRWFLVRHFLPDRPCPISHPKMSNVEWFYFKGEKGRPNLFPESPFQVDSGFHVADND